MTGRNCFSRLLLLVIAVSGSVRGAEQSNQLAATARQQLSAPKSAHKGASTNNSVGPSAGSDRNPVAVKVLAMPAAGAETPEDRERRVAHDLNEQVLTSSTQSLSTATHWLLFVS